MAIYCVKCGARHECSVCPVCAGFGLSNLQAAAGVGKSFQPADELRAKFEALCVDRNWSTRKLLSGLYFSHSIEDVWDGYQLGYASRDAEVEALRKDARRWRHARKLLTIEDIEEAQRDFVSYGRMVSEEGCAYADQAIDAAMREESK